MSPSEIAFLALGLVLGAAIGAAIMEAIRARPAPRREVRLTIAPNSLDARQGTTLADSRRAGSRPPIPGSPDDDAWPRTAPATTDATAPRDPGPELPVRTRTPVPSPPVTLPERAVGIPVQRPAPVQPASPPAPPARPVGAPPTQPSSSAEPPSPRPAPGGPDGPPAGSSGPSARAVSGAAVAVLDPARGRAARTDGHANETEGTTPERATGDRAPVGAPSAQVPATSVGIVSAVASREAAADRADGSETPDGPVGSGARNDSAGVRAPGGPATPAAAGAAPGADPCEAVRRLVDERCAVAASAREQAGAVADALREAQRAYDDLRERVERSQALADPREVAAGKEALHRAFRAASASASGAEATERAAREWLDQINELNARTREATRVVEAGTAELRAALPRLERLTVEADAARIGAEGAETACRDAREALAQCEEPAAEAAIEAASAAAGQPAWPAPPAWPPSVGPSSEAGPEAAPEVAAETVIARVLRGDRATLDGLVASLGGGDGEQARQWQLRLAQLVDAIAARAIEDGYLDLPDDEPFWGLFPPRERREIVGALSALGFRFDGLGGFTDGRVPAPRDLSLAVGYAGLDRMRIRAWPHESELGTLFAHATVAGGEWLAHEAGDLSLGEMVDALGGRAGDLADLWNAWGRVRPALLATTI